jgi:hypothetical protein
MVASNEKLKGRVVRCSIEEHDVVESVKRHPVTAQTATLECQERLPSLSHDSIQVTQSACQSCLILRLITMVSKVVEHAVPVTHIL